MPTIIPLHGPEIGKSLRMSAKADPYKIFGDLKKHRIRYELRFSPLATPEQKKVCCRLDALLRAERALAERRPLKIGEQESWKSLDEFETTLDRLAEAGKYPCLVADDEQLGVIIGLTTGFDHEVRC